VTTALDIIESALGLTNAVGVDQTLTAAETADCLARFNRMVDNWSTQDLAVYNSPNQTFATVAGQAVYTIGVGGDWNTDRPIGISVDAICTYQGVNFPVVNMTQEQYNNIVLPTQQQPIISRYLYVNDFPLAKVTLWPTPSEVVSMTFTMNRLLTGPATAATTISFPPGYEEAFEYNLAVRLAPLFGKTASDNVQRMANESLADVKRSNRTPAVAKFDAALAPRGGVIWQRGY